MPVHVKARGGLPKKPIAYFDNRHGNTDGYLLGAKCPTPPEGATIEADTKSWEYQGKTYWGLESWKLVESSPQARNFAPPQGSVNGQCAPQSPPARGWDIQSGDLSRYASNIVASAITTGLIKDPEDILGWAAVAYVSGQRLRDGSYPAVTDFGARPDPSEDQGRDEFNDSLDAVPF